MRILHAADLHLGIKYSQLPRNVAQTMRHASISVLQNLVQLANENQAILLLAGDTFEAQAITEAELAQATSILEQCEMPIVAVAGNHDPYYPQSLYERFVDLPNFHLLGVDSMRLDLPQYDLTIYGQSFKQIHVFSSLMPEVVEKINADRMGDEKPLTNNVLLMHGDIYQKQNTSVYNPMALDTLMELPVAYVALGHIHKPENFKLGVFSATEKCCYAGAPIGHSFKNIGPKRCLLVELEENRIIKQEAISLDIPRFEEQRIVLQSAHTLAQSEEILKFLQTDENYKRNLYRLYLKGETEFEPDLSAIKLQLPCYVELFDRTVRPLAEQDTDSVKGLFAHAIAQKKSRPDLTSEEQEIIDLAYSLGLEILKGELDILDRWSH